MLTLQHHIRLLSLLLLVAALPAWGQRSSRSGLGLKIGAQMANTRSAAFSYDPVPGAVLGVYAPLRVADRFEVQPEVLLSMQGSAYAPTEGTRTVNHLYYAQLPVSAKLYVSNALNLQAGLQAGLLLMANSNGADTKHLFKSTDLGLNLGLGVDLINGTDLTLRYYSGLTTVLVNDDLIYPSNRTLQFTAGYRFLRFKRHTRRRSH